MNTHRWHRTVKSIHTALGPKDTQLATEKTCQAARSFQPHQQRHTCSRSGFTPPQALDLQLHATYATQQAWLRCISYSLCSSHCSSAACSTWLHDINCCAPHHSPRGHQVPRPSTASHRTSDWLYRAASPQQRMAQHRQNTNIHISTYKQSPSTHHMNATCCNVQLMQNVGGWTGQSTPNFSPAGVVINHTQAPHNHQTAYNLHTNKSCCKSQQAAAQLPCNCVLCQQSLQATAAARSMSAQLRPQHPPQLPLLPPPGLQQCCRCCSC